LTHDISSKKPLSVHLEQRKGYAFNLGHPSSMAIDNRKIKMNNMLIQSTTNIFSIQPTLFSLVSSIITTANNINDLLSAA
jgi:hypothetical protein